GPGPGGRPPGTPTTARTGWWHSAPGCGTRWSRIQSCHTPGRCAGWPAETVYGVDQPRHGIERRGGQHPVSQVEDVRSAQPIAKELNRGRVDDLIIGQQHRRVEVALDH